MKKFLSFFLIFALFFALGIASFSSVIVAEETSQQVCLNKDVLVDADLNKERSDYVLTPCINWYGRFESFTNYKNSNTKVKKVVNTASGFEVSFTGTKLTVTLSAESMGNAGGFLNGNKVYARVYVDGDTVGTLVSFTNSPLYKDFDIATGLSNDGTIHTVKMLKATEEDFGIYYISKLTTDGSFYSTKPEPEYVIDVYGDSITAGYGILGDPSQTQGDLSVFDGTSTYALMVAKELNAQVNVVCAQGISLSFPVFRPELLKNCYDKKSIKSGSRHYLEYFIPNLIIINIGTNDSREINSKDTVKTFIDDYKQMIKGLIKYSPDTRVVCVYGMMGSNDIVEEAIKDMVAAYRKAGNNKIFYVQPETCSYGSCGHPDVQTNRITANMIIEVATSKLEEIKVKDGNAGGIFNCSLSFGAKNLSLALLISAGLFLIIKKINEKEN